MSAEVKKYAYVDALRAIAVLGVLVVHVRDAVPFGSHWLLKEFCDAGQMGVQLFFVASALTLCLSMKSRGTGSNEFLAYGFRRFFRIAPLYYVAIAVYFFVRHNPYGNVQYTLVNVLGNVLFVHGFLPFVSNGLVPGSWSIGTEMLFYLFFPLLFSMLTDFRKASLAFSLHFGVLCYAVLLSRLGYLSDFHVPNNQFLYFNLFTQLPAFLAGIGIFHLVKFPPETVPSHTVGAVALVALLFAVRISHTSWSARYLLTPGFYGIFFAGAAFLLARHGEPGLSTALGRVLREIGKKSYAIYLFHFPIAWGVWPACVKSLPPDLSPWALMTVGALFVLAASYAIAWFFALALENPGIALGRQLSERFAERIDGCRSPSQQPRT